MREYQVRICERLRVKFPGPTRQKTEVSGLARHVRFTFRSRHRQPARACPFGADSVEKLRCRSGRSSLIHSVSLEGDRKRRWVRSRLIRRRYSTSSHLSDMFRPPICWGRSTVEGDRPLCGAGSFREIVCWGLIEQGLSGPFIELPCDRAEFGLAM